MRYSRGDTGRNRVRGAVCTCRRKFISKGKLPHTLHTVTVERHRPNHLLPTYIHLVYNHLIQPILTPKTLPPTVHSTLTRPPRYSPSNTVVVITSHALTLPLPHPAYAAGRLIHTTVPRYINESGPSARLPWAPAPMRRCAFRP